MTEFITTFPSDVTNAAYVKNLCTAAFDGTESTVTSTGADSRYQRIVDTGAPIAGLEFTFSVTVRKPVAETVTGARLLISDSGFGDILTKSITLTDSDVTESITHTFGGGTGGNTIVIRIDYPEPQQGTNGHQIIVKNHSLVDAVAPNIDNVDGDGEITDGQGTATLTTSGFAADINSITVTDGTYTTANLFIGGSAGNWTWQIDDILNQVADSAPGQPDWFQGSLEVIASDGTGSASAPFVWNPQAGANTNVVIGAVDTAGSIYETRGSLPPDNSSNMWETANNTDVAPSGIYTTDITNGTFKGVLWDATDGTLENWSVTISSGGGGNRFFTTGGLGLGIGIGFDSFSSFFGVGGDHVESFSDEFTEEF